MRIGFAGRWDPRDKRSWSGTYHYAYQQLQRLHEVEVFLFEWTWRVREGLLLQKQAAKLFHRKASAVEFLTGYAKYFSRQLDKALAQSKIDLVFAPAAPQLIAYLQSPVPVVFMTDATFQQIQGYYPDWQNIASSNLKQGIKVDSRAFHKAAHNLVASEWCKQSAVRDYVISPNKVSVAPLGANLDEPPLFFPERRKADVCRLLFLGVEWERKGGPLALETFRELRRMGLDATLHIIGCVPPVPVADEGITVIPYLNKNIPAEQEQLRNILAETHFLLLPTRAECAGVVFCEASAYGIPSITTDTGGVPTYVRDGVNGYALPHDASADQYAAQVYTLFQDFNRYQTLSQSSRKLYDDVLNWERWGESFNAIAQALT